MGRGEQLFSPRATQRHLQEEGQRIQNWKLPGAPAGKVSLTIFHLEWSSHLAWGWGKLHHQHLLGFSPWFSVSHNTREHTYTSIHTQLYRQGSH